MISFPPGEYGTLKVPEATIIRLSLYSRFLQQLIEKGVTMVMSAEIASGTGVNAAQVRKDLAYFGEFGLRGVGYYVKELYRNVMTILGLNREWNVVVIGAGNLGQALSLYRGFSSRGFKIAAVFDTDDSKIGQKLHDLEILPISKLLDFADKNPFEVGVITVPAKFAQKVADLLVLSKVKAILNFAPVVIAVPDEIDVRNVDLTVNLELLTFKMGLKNPQHTP